MTQNDLETIERNRREMMRLRSQLMRLREPVGAIPITGMPSGGGGGNSVESLVIQQDTIRAEIDALQQESRRICFQIEPPRTRRVFILFYAEGMSWRQVADELGYTEGATPRRMRNEYLKRHNLR